MLNIFRIRSHSVFVGGLILALFCSLSVAMGQDVGEGAAMSPEQQAMLSRLRSIQWHEGPTTGKVGSMGQIEVPQGYQFTESAGAQALLEAYGNLPNRKVLGLLQPTSAEDDWFLVFQFEDIGYVKDEDKDALDADNLISTFRDGIGPGNEQRRAMGAEEITSINWAEKPFYDSETNNLTWALNIGFPSGNSINYDIRVLGRHGVMEVTLVGDPETYSEAVPKVKQVLTGYSFTDGNKYSQWVQGDKVAQYGLAGLVAGGTLAAAAKSGLLGKLGLLIAKMGKAVVLVVVLIGGAIASFFRRLFGGGSDN